MKTLLSKFILSGVLLTLLLSSWLYGLVTQFLYSPINLSEHYGDEIVVTIRAGTSFKALSWQLYDKGIIKYPRILVAYARISGQTKIKMGEYLITKKDVPRSLLEKFNQGDVVQHSITLPEGWSFKQMVEEIGQIDQFAEDSLLHTLSLLTLANIQVEHPEGWFYPDTYSYTSTDSIADLLARAHDKMVRVLDAEWSLRAPDLPYTEPYEALIMASIIEKETGLPSERKQIAGVFVRRLQAGMRLQTDPTVIYGMGDDYQGNIRRSDLKRATPYNTYRINGLPPTPIAMPGRAAINAALHPEPGSALYFVARGDGGHYFSDTLDEHNRAVQKYQIEQRAKNYQSAPNQH
jgi:UPF0755 protein